MGVNYADVFETVARAVDKDRPAVICDRQITTWGEFDRRSNALGRALIAAALGLQAKVGLYMRNAPDYLIAFAACLKARLVPVNINFRYGPAEIAYLLDNADVEALIHDAEFADVVAALPPNSLLKSVFCRGAGGAAARQLDAVYRGPSDPIAMARDAEDIFLMYTGGTTGLPKGVMWPSSAVWGALAPSRAQPGQPPPMTLAALAAQLQTAPSAPRYFIAPPLMHGTGLFAALSVMANGGTVVISSARTFDAATTVADLADLACDGLVIVGDAFARPILDVLEAQTGERDVSRITAVVSSGMMWSPEVKQGLLRFMPNAVLADGLGATESSSIAFAVTTRDTQGDATRFTPNGAVVLRPDTLTPVAPGTGEIGLVAKAGDLPIGYYKDPERTARTYVTLNGVRHMISGDHATVDNDGTIRLLGRGSHCINTAGEKVFPEEVEEALKTHPDVTDALVFGLPDPRFGQKVAALVAVRGTAAPETLADHVRSRLAGYKVPRAFAFVGSVPRAPNGKADYAAARAMFDELSGKAEAR